MIDIFLPCVPPTTNHHAKRIVRVGQWSRLADTPELVAAKETLDTLLKDHRPAAPLSGPLSLTLEFTWPWRAGDSKRVRALGRLPRMTKPDCDNLAKGITDRMAVLRFFEQDAAVVELTVRKFFGDVAGIRIQLAPLPTTRDHTPARAAVAHEQKGVLPLWPSV